MLWAKPLVVAVSPVRLQLDAAKAAQGDVELASLHTDTEWSRAARLLGHLIELMESGNEDLSSVFFFFAWRQQN